MHTVFISQNVYIYIQNRLGTNAKSFFFWKTVTVSAFLLLMQVFSAVRNLCRLQVQKDVSNWFNFAFLHVVVIQGISVSTPRLWQRWVSSSRTVRDFSASACDRVHSGRLCVSFYVCVLGPDWFRESRTVQVTETKYVPSLSAVHSCASKMCVLLIRVRYVPLSFKVDTLT